MNPILKVERLRPRRPMTIRARIWAQDDQDRVERFSRLLQQMVPHERAMLRLGTTPGDRTYIDSLGGHVAPEQIPELLRRCEAENLQLVWGADVADPTLDVICELYDDHIEVAARPPLADQVERALSEVVRGAA